MTEQHDLRHALVRAARDLRRSGEEATLRYEHLDAVRSAPGDPAAELRRLIASAPPEDLAATIHLARLLRVTGLDDAVADAALRRPVPLAAKSAAVRVLREAGTLVPTEVTETLALAGEFVAEPTLERLDRVMKLPEAWRQPALGAWADKSLAVAPAVAEAAMERGIIEPLQVAERLGSGGDAAAVELLRRLAGGQDRAVGKAAKRSLHKLRSRGVVVEEEAAGAAFTMQIEPDVVGESLAYVTGIDGMGGRIVWILVPSATGGYRLLEAVTDDVHGLRKADVMATTRGDFRRHMAKLRDNPSVLVATVPTAAAVELLRGAEHLNGKSGTEVPVAYRDFRVQDAAALFGDDMAQDGADPVGEADAAESDDSSGAAAIGDLPEAPASEDVRREVLRESVELLGAEYFGAWAILGTAADEAAAAVRAAEVSELLVDDEQRKQQIDRAIAGVAEQCGAEERRRYRRRLHDMARLLTSLGQSEAAVRARVAGDAFETADDLYADHPLARAMVQRGVMAAYQHLRQHEPPAAAAAATPPSGIIQP